MYNYKDQPVITYGVPAGFAEKRKQIKKVKKNVKNYIKTLPINQLRIGWKGWDDYVRQCKESEERMK